MVLLREEGKRGPRSSTRVEPGLLCDSQYSSCKPARLCHPAVCLPLGQVERDLYERCTALGMAIFSISHKLELKVSAYLYSPRYSEPAPHRSPRHPAL